jgi:hypothetical protein
MHSTKFRPVFTVEPTTVQDLFRKASDRTGTFTKDAPDELKSELFKK